jgi:hypothetical protein
VAAKDGLPFATGLKSREKRQPVATLYAIRFTQGEDVRGCHCGTVKAAQIPYPTITRDRAIVSDHAITIGSIVSHCALCFGFCWVMACVSAACLQCRKSVR